MEEKTIRLVVGQGKYHNAEDVVTLKDYPFKNVAFIINDMKEKSSITTFRRVIGMLFGAEKAKIFIEKWEKSKAKGEDITKELIYNYNIYFANADVDKETIVSFVKEKLAGGYKVKILLLGAYAIDLKESLDFESKNKEKLTILTYRHPSPHNDPYFFKEFDYKYKNDSEEKYSTSENIKEIFQIK